jgi:DNA (cytosine-5)-methyltransferase 1
MTGRPRLLDLFCGAGGCSVGYQRAGFDVVGVDNRPQLHYPFEFCQHDAMELLNDVADYGQDVLHDSFGHIDVIHASPPCEAFTQMSARWRGKGTKADEHPDLLTPTLAILRPLGLPYVVENVQGARAIMRTTLTLHGGMFGLGVHRPRLFESNVLLLSARTRQAESPIGVYGTKPDGRTTYRYRNNGNYKGKSLIRAAKSIEEAREVMGIDWMDWDEIRKAIPPAYTEFIGTQLLEHLRERAA